MRRLASIMAASAWLGYLGISGGLELWRASGHAVNPAQTVMPDLFSEVAMFLRLASPSHALAAAVLCLLAAGALTVATVLLASGRAWKEALGERLCLGVLLALGLMAGLSSLTGILVGPFAAVGPGVLVALALSLGAVIFDRLITVPPEADDRDEFFAAVDLLTLSMAKQTRLFAIRPANDRRPTR